MREKPAKTCGTVLAGLAAYAGRGFLTDEGARDLMRAKRKAPPARSPWDDPA